MFKAIIFDVGNVIMMHPERIYGSITAKYAKTHRTFLKKTRHDFLLCQKGRISYMEYFRRAAKKFGISHQKMKKDVAAVHKAFDEHVTINEEVVGIIKRLNSYKLACLTNTIPEHYNHHKKEQVYSLFKIAVISCKVGMAKPYKNIYRYTLKKLGVKAGEAVFIDDNPDFVRTAKSLGMKTILFKDAAQLKRDLTKLKVI